MPNLKVFPNPYKQLDHKGRPSSVLPYEPEGNGITTFDARRFVGAQLKSKILQTFAPGDARQTVQDNWYEFGDEAVEVPDTPYYRRAILQGDLIAADPFSARRSGTKFVEPKEILEKSKEGAIHHRRHVEAHDEIDLDLIPEEIGKHAFGPMTEAVEARKVAAKEEEKKVKAEAVKAEEEKRLKEEEKKAKADELKAKVEADKKTKGGE